MHLEVSVPQQEMRLCDGNSVITTYPISTSKYGLGETEGSNRTPRGRHTITEKIGADAEPGTIFKGRVPTGELWTPDLVTEDDLITTRILWLAGEEPHNANTHDRYIYIHGTNQEQLIGTPASHGCVRMTNADIITFFNQVDIGTPVMIE